MNRKLKLLVAGAAVILIAHFSPVIADAGTYCPTYKYAVTITTRVPRMQREYFSWCTWISGYGSGGFGEGVWCSYRNRSGQTLTFTGCADYTGWVRNWKMEK